jgi:hypothetical protein
MKNHNFITACLICFAINIIQVSGQSSLNLHVGAGNPELFHIGVRYHVDILQMGVSLGFVGKSSYSVTGEFLYHFGKFQDLSMRKRMYARIGSSYLKEKNEYEIFTSFTIHTRIGREFIINDRMGVGLDGGLMFRIIEEKTVIKPRTGWGINFDLGILEYVLPAFGVYIYCRI